MKSKKKYQKYNSFFSQDWLSEPIELICMLKVSDSEGSIFLSFCLSDKWPNFDFSSRCRPGTEVTNRSVISEKSYSFNVSFNFSTFVQRLAKKYWLFLFRKKEPRNTNFEVLMKKEIFGGNQTKMIAYDFLNTLFRSDQPSFGGLRISVA